MMLPPSIVDMRRELDRVPHHYYMEFRDSFKNPYFEGPVPPAQHHVNMHGAPATADSEPTVRGGQLFARQIRGRAEDRFFVDDNIQIVAAGVT